MNKALTNEDKIKAIHCNWADNVTVQIRIEDDAMFISNCSILPFGWTAETLLGSHSSKPYNPDIARVFYRAGYIESWDVVFKKSEMLVKISEQTNQSILFMAKILW